KVVTTADLRAQLKPGETLRGYYDAFVARQPDVNIAIFDANRRLVGTMTPMSHFILDDDGTLRFDAGPAHFVIKGQRIVLRDSAGNLAGYLYRLPPDGAETMPPPPTEALDRSFTWTFTVAALFGVLMAVLIARLITGPVKGLTAAVRRMEGGDFAVRVDPRGGPELAGLARAFNSMAATLDRNEELRRRMVSDVAH